MTLKQRQQKLIKQIPSLNEEELSMLEQELSFFTHTAGKDIVDGLNSDQLEELINQANEPSEVDAINEVEYKNSTSKWRSK